MRYKFFLIIFIIILAVTALSEDNVLYKKFGKTEHQSKRFLLWSPMSGSESFYKIALNKLEGLEFDVNKKVSENTFDTRNTNTDIFYKNISNADSYSIISFYTHGSGGKGLTFEYFPETEEGRKARDKRYLELMERYAKEDYERFIKIFTEEIYKELIDKYPERDREPDLKESLSETEMAKVISRIINDVGYYWPYVYREYDQIIPFVKELYDQNITLLSEFMKYLIPRLNWENDYFERGSHLEGGGSYVIILKHKFIDRYFKQTDSLVMLFACSMFSSPEMKESFTSPSTGKGAAIVMGSPDPVVGNQSIELDLLLSFLTGKKPYYFEDEQPNPRINYTIEEINSFLSNVPRLSQYQFYGKGDLDYLLYRQPRIVSLVVKDETDNKIYDFQHENNLNPKSEYISEEKLKNSRVKQVKLDNKLKFSISFSDNVDISEKAVDLLSKSNGYSFKLYKNRLPNTSDHNRKDCYVEATKVKVGPSLKSTEMIFDLTDFKKCEEEFGTNYLYFVAKVPDSYKHDEMVYLDTAGSGRDDKRGRCKHNEGCKYPDKDITANDGLDTNHWLQINPIPKMTLSSMEIDELHLPFQQAPPDGRVNMQPVMLNGDIALPENFSWQIVTCDDKTGVELERCIYNINQNNYNNNLEPTYYLNSKMLKPFTFDPKSVKTADELINALYPVFHAELSDKNADLESLVADGSIKDYIDIYLEIIPYQPGEGQMARNHAGPPMEPIRIDNDMYYAFFFTSAANNIMIALPLKSIFLDRYPSLPDGTKALPVFNLSRIYEIT